VRIYPPRAGASCAASATGTLGALYTNFREFPLCEVRAPLHLPRTRAATLLVSTVLCFYSTRSEQMWDVCPAVSYTRVGCCSVLGCLMCERGVLVKVMVGDVNNVKLDVLYIVPIQRYQYPMKGTTRHPVLR
jgi:hypothetical protein